MWIGQESDAGRVANEEKNFNLQTEILRDEVQRLELGAYQQ